MTSRVATGRCLAAMLVAGLVWLVFGVLLRALRRSAKGEAVAETDE